MINMIVAMASNGVIGKNNLLPWRIAEDLKCFKKLTMDGMLFVGKKTAQSLPNLQGREIVVLNKNSFPQLSDIKNIAEISQKKIWIIGGAQIYNAALNTNIVDALYITKIDKEYDGDTYFPIDTINNSNGWILGSEEILRDNDPLTKLQIWNKISI